MNNVYKLIKFIEVLSKANRNNPDWRSSSAGSPRGSPTSWHPNNEDETWQFKELYEFIYIIYHLLCRKRKRENPSEIPPSEEYTEKSLPNGELDKRESEHVTSEKFPFSELFTILIRYIRSGSTIPGWVIVVLLIFALILLLFVIIDCYDLLAVRKLDHFLLNIQNFIKEYFKFWQTKKKSIVNGYDSLQQRPLQLDDALQIIDNLIEAYFQIRNGTL